MTISPVASPETRPTIPPYGSSPLSFRTAVASQPTQESPLAGRVREERSISSLSSIVSIPNDYLEDNSNTPKYPLSPKALPFELYQHCLVYLEEQLCKESQLKNSLLTCYRWQSNNASKQSFGLSWRYKRSLCGTSEPYRLHKHSSCPPPLYHQSHTLRAC
jgi:hypothetical protein